MQTILYQITWFHAAEVYLVLCSCIGLWWIGVCVYEDVRMCRQPWRKANSKFGYNYKSRFSWIVMVFLSLPILNIFTGIAFAYIAIRNYFNRPNYAQPL